MRWKEYFLVPDHRVRTISGASFEGFYYICFNQIEGTVTGIYFHAKSEKYVLHSCHFGVLILTFADINSLNSSTSKTVVVLPRSNSVNSSSFSFRFIFNGHDIPVNDLSDLLVYPLESIVPCDY